MEKIKSYNENIGISQSALKDFLIHPMFYKLKHIDGVIKKEKKSYFDLGSLVDCTILTPQYFDEIYAIYDKTINPQVKILCEHIVNYNIDYSSYDIILEEIRKLNIFNTIKKIETIKKKLEDEKFEEYINFYSNNKGKTIIDYNFYYKGIEIAASLLNSDFTKNYFQEREGIEILTAQPIYWEYEDDNIEYGPINCKSLLDLIIIDHFNNIIFVNDLKTTAEYTSEFNKSIMKYRYDFQGAYYREAVKWWIKNDRLDLKNYKVAKEFNLIVESTTKIGSPLVYKLNKSTLDRAKDGDMYYERNQLKLLPGFKKALEDLKWHYIEDKWFYTREQYENKGIINCC